MPQRVLICGDRNWENDNVIRATLLAVLLKDGIELVIDGGASGADYIGRQMAATLNLPLITYSASWCLYGKRAGPIRNAEMIKDGKPTIVLAFHNNIEKSKGTKDMVSKARKAKIPVIIITEQGIDNEH